jgi:hypothetical protein
MSKYHSLSRYPHQLAWERLSIALVLAMAAAFSGAGVVSAASTRTAAVPQVVCCGGGGGYTYPSSSPYYVMNIFTDGSGQEVVLRQGNSSFGWDHIVSKHSIVSWAPLTMALQRGRQLYDSQSNNTEFRVVVYDVPLYETDGIYFSVNLLVAANLYQVMENNWYLGIITAYCPGYTGACPEFVDYGQVGYGGTW